MKRRASIIVLSLMGAALFGGVAAFISAKSDAPALDSPRPAIEIAASDLYDVRLSEMRRSIALTGTLQPRNWTTVKAKASGELREISVREGEPVKAGQIVARIDAIEAQAKLQEKLADLEGARAQLVLAEKNRENQHALLKQKFISQNAFDVTESNYLVAEARLKAVDAQAAIARKSLEDTTVRAPIAGIVSQRLAQPGEKVAIDARILALVDLSELEVESAIPASDISSVRPGQEIQFRVEGYGDRIFAGRIERINPSTQSGTRSIIVYALLPNRDGALRGGLFAKGNLTIEKREKAMVLPSSAVSREGSQWLVWRLTGGRLSTQPVTIGMRNDDEGVLEALDGLKPGDQILRTQLGGLRSGATVTITPARAQPEPARPAVAGSRPAGPQSVRTGG
ncbi:MAG: efflux RND transporter periplasmic adaptor subunit [Betaproteobacteria bacterium]|nr:efflux RND transporter periplasmic adaptor subunit [Betaproteobacteria bacterium]